MSKYSKTTTCTACGGSVGSDALRFSQAGEQAAFCSFECIIEFAAGRIRQRREHHNKQMDELRRKFRATKKGNGDELPMVVCVGAQVECGD